MGESYIYEGHVHHRRCLPVEHVFRRPLFLMYLDLAELDKLFERRWLWSSKRRAPAWFRRADHLGDPQIDLVKAVRELARKQTGQQPEGPIRLLTHLRYFGYAMNPLSLYYCFDGEGQRVETIIAEVNNTPWGEQHCYTLPVGLSSENKWGEASHTKEFHVSPFMGMNQSYSWRLSYPGERLTVGIESFEQGEKRFDATLSLRRRPITSAQLARVLLRYPFMTGQVVAAIYWQALRLWWKGCPTYAHPQQKTDSPLVTS